MRAPLSFRKYEGLGNDFMVVEAASEDALSPERVAALCDRRFGVGADGVLLVLPPRNAGSVATMRVVNADGSVPEMCGNGVRCVALHLARKRGLREGVLTIDTDAGPRECAVQDDGEAGLVTVDMGVIRLDGERTLDVDGHPIALRLADAGNPHAILFGAFARSDIERMGPRLATHPAFARGSNVEFASVGAGGIDLVVWERGCGITLACGTGACATAAVACATGRAEFDRPIAVRLPGGTLAITIARDGRATMRGPAKFVFSGETAL
jgi:diaminopimelate epimerase